MSITYELAKQLKEAGFPQKGENGFISDKGFWYGYFNCGYCPDAFGQPTSKKDNAYIPTLSELLEACGEPFWTLHKHVEGKYAGYWEACLNPTDRITSGKQKTPEEAVSHLWLIMNKK